MLNQKMNKQIERYQRELIDTHYQEVETMYKKCEDGGMIIVITFKP